MISTELFNLKNEIESLGQYHGTINKISEFTYVWEPQKKNELLFEKPIHLTLQAITHGNEIGGIYVIKKIVELLKNKQITPNISIAFVLANYKAAVRNQRFIDYDLNRVFGSKGGFSLEHNRAKEIESVLNQTYFLLDIHQTIEFTTTPFFVFKFNNSALDFVKNINNTIPVVTYFDEEFSKDGFCSDEFVLNKGGVGVTIEISQKGNDSIFIERAVDNVLKCIRYVEQYSLSKSETNSIEPNELYNCSDIIYYEDGSELNPGLHNFKEVSAGDILGKSNNGPIIARIDGYILFPKYNLDKYKVKPKEICQIIRKIQLDKTTKI